MSATGHETRQRSKEQLGVRVTAYTEAKEAFAHSEMERKPCGDQKEKHFRERE